MILERMAIACDLSSVSMEEAFKRCFGNGKTLVVSTKNITLGEALIWTKDITLKVDTNLSPDAWYVTTEWDGVFSPGA